MAPDDGVRQRLQPGERSLVREDDASQRRAVDVTLCVQQRLAENSHHRGEGRALRLQHLTRDAVGINDAGAQRLQLLQHLAFADGDIARQADDGLVRPAAHCFLRRAQPAGNASFCSATRPGSTSSYWIVSISSRMSLELLSKSE